MKDEEFDDDLCNEDLVVPIPNETNSIIVNFHNNFQSNKEIFDTIDDHNNEQQNDAQDDS